jgi:hypothetical protein
MLRFPGYVTPPAAVQFRTDTKVVDVFDFVEVTARVANPVEGNPFTEADLAGTLLGPDGIPRPVSGFCDSEDGTIFRIRFMPREPGIHRYRIRYRTTAAEAPYGFSGWFSARSSGRKGPVQVDPAHPFHFVRHGTGERFFYTGATAYHLLSWADGEQMLSHASRMMDAGANRIRFLNFGRASDDEWSEGMLQSESFLWTVSPWPARFPERQLAEGSIEPDHARFDLAHWRKAERLVRALRDRDVVAAVNLYMDRGIVPQYGPDDAPAPGSAAEDLYFRYAVARLGAFSNVMWDLGTEHDEYRTAEWAEVTGSRLRESDPYGHLVSAHPNQFRSEYLAEPWYSFAEYQYYGVEPDSFGDDVLERVNGQVRFWRDEVRRNGRPIPQVNEEYGYELDPSGYDESHAQIRKKAWAIVMGGGYVTSGERKAWQHGDPSNGGQVAPDTRILAATTRMRRFFEDRAIPYWEMEPMEDLDGAGAFGLEKGGSRYVVYLPGGGSVLLDLPVAAFSAEWFDPRTGAATPIGIIGGGSWRSPEAPVGPGGDDSDTVLYLARVP